MYDVRGDPVKHLNDFKTHVSLRRAMSTMKYRAFHLTLSGAVEVWYTRLSKGNIQSLLDFKKVFFKCFATSKEDEGPIQHLQDMGNNKGNY